jgi:hypothetical protein
MRKLHSEIAEARVTTVAAAPQASGDESADTIQWGVAVLAAMRARQQSETPPVPIPSKLAVQEHFPYLIGGWFSLHCALLSDEH